ncbi:MAG: hypothetical protein V2A58_17445 [Planctomycetota bacterium]
MTQLIGGFAQEDITPSGPTPLAGYFNERISTGVIDPVRAKAAWFEGPGTQASLVVLDLVGLRRVDTELIRSRVEDTLGVPGARVLVTCTHTHTAPATKSLFGLGFDARYVPDVVAPSVCRAVERARKSAQPLSVRTGSTVESGLAFNRRYWMKNGTVLTNPPKGDPNIVRPEGPVDHTVRVYAFETDGKPIGIVVAASNHTDTTGGEKVSADWPGVLAAEMTDRLGGAFPVLLLNSPAGNINHFDLANPDAQCSRSEAVRIGKGYARFALEALKSAAPMEALPLAAASESFDLPYREVSEKELAAARALVATARSGASRRLTSEELAKGDPEVELIFARGLFDFAELRARADHERQEVAGLRLGDAAFIGLPGEPFVEIGLAIREASPFKFTSVFALLGDLAGYVPMPECFDQGGYEPRTHRYNRFARNAAGVFIEKALEVLKKLRASSPGAVAAGHVNS